MKIDIKLVHLCAVNRYWLHIVHTDDFGSGGVAQDASRSSEELLLQQHNFQTLIAVEWAGLIHFNTYSPFQWNGSCIDGILRNAFLQC